MCKQLLAQRLAQHPACQRFAFVMLFQLRDNVAAELRETLTRQIHTASLNNRLLFHGLTRDLCENLIGPTSRRCEISKSHPMFSSNTNKRRELRRSLRTLQHA